MLVCQVSCSAPGFLFLLIEIKDLYEQNVRGLDSIRCGAEEILKDRIDNHLTQDLSDFKTNESIRRTVRSLPCRFL